MGGIAKIPGDTPDILHSYLSYVALAMHLEDKDEQLEKLPALARVSASLNVSRATLSWIQANVWTHRGSNDDVMSIP